MNKCICGIAFSKPMVIGYTIDSFPGLPRQLIIFLLVHIQKRLFDNDKEKLNEEEVLNSCRSFVLKVKVRFLFRS